MAPKDLIQRPQNHKKFNQFQFHKRPPDSQFVVTLAAESNSGWGVPPLLRGNPFAHHFLTYYAHLFSDNIDPIILTYSENPPTNGPERFNTTTPKS